MNNVKIILGITFILLFVAGIIFFEKDAKNNSTMNPIHEAANKTSGTVENSLTISAMRKKNYPGSDLKIEQTLTPGSNYNQYIASYQSDGLKIYGLLTIPTGKKPTGGWPAIIFNHGYIPPDQYKTTERYIAYVDEFARNGYVVFKSDYRGNGSSDGQPEGAYYSPAYATDVLNALSSVKKFKDVNPQKIGMWGHSMGGNITLRSLVVDPQDIKVAVIWGGVVGSYDDLMNRWLRRVPFRPGPTELALRNRSRQKLTDQYGTPTSNPTFWNSIDPTFFVKDITAPIQLDHSVTDEEVPLTFSESLKDKLQKAGKKVELYTYPGDDHNISANLNIALQRSLEFFDTYVKGGEKI